MVGERRRKINVGQEQSKALFKKNYLKGHATYLPTLEKARNEAKRYMRSIGAKFENEEEFEMEEISEAFMDRGSTKSWHYELFSLFGKGTRKYAHVVIYRMRQNYELVIYFL